MTPCREHQRDWLPFLMTALVTAPGLIPLATGSGAHLRTFMPMYPQIRPQSVRTRSHELIPSDGKRSKLPNHRHLGRVDSGAGLQSATTIPGDDGKHLDGLGVGGGCRWRQR
jgi:hypothetical protein